jgi:hypothetical protein
MRQQYLPFADWLKALGLAVIVWGHVAATTTVRWTPPVYPKQLGVAFFIFVTGFTLSREHRGAGRVFYNRLFEVFFFGILAALAMSAVTLVLHSDLNESNYLPFVGLHLVQDSFPANPTTWYIGCYLHLLLLWAFILRRFKVTLPLIFAVSVGEVLVRAFLIREAGLFVAYMALSNWLSVLLFGILAGRQAPEDEAVFAARSLWLAPLILLWPIAASFVQWRLTFPLMGIAGLDPVSGTLTVAIATSIVYVGFTLGMYGVTRRLPRSAFVQFLARNTVVVFIAHMPVYYILEYLLQGIVTGYGPRVTLEFLICLPGLALCSEYLRRLLPPAVLRDRIAARFGYSGTPDSLKTA